MFIELQNLIHLCCRVRPWIVAVAAPQLAARGSHVCTAANGQLYAIGGWDAKNYMDAVGTP